MNVCLTFAVVNHDQQQSLKQSLALALSGGRREERHNNNFFCSFDFRAFFCTEIVNKMVSYQAFKMSQLTNPSITSKIIVSKFWPMSQFRAATKLSCAGIVHVITANMIFLQCNVFNEIFTKISKLILPKTNKIFKILWLMVVSISVNLNGR